MKRIIFTTLAGLTAFALVTGLAASMNVTSTNLGADTDVVSACDQDGLSVAFGIDPTSITDVSVVSLTDVAAACDGQDYYLELVGSTLGTLTGTVSLSDIDGDGLVDDMDVSLTSVASAASITGVDLTITG